MSTIGRQEPPGSLVHFILAVEESRVGVPEDAHRALGFLWRACIPSDEAASKRKPRDRLNRLVGQARRRDPGLFRELWRWARTAEVREACSRFGACGAWRECRRAFAAISRGVPAHRAFGMSQGGKPSLTEFTRYQSAAFRAQFYIQNGVLVSEAIERARLIEGLGVESERAIKRNRDEIVWVKNHKTGG